MSRENVELVRRLIDASERRDVSAAYAAFSPDIEWRVERIAGPVGFEPVYVGEEGVRTFFRQWFEAWEGVSFEYEELIDAGDKVVVVLTQRMRGRTSGVELEWRSYAQVWTVRDDKLVRMEFFPSRAEALEAVGMDSAAPAGGRRPDQDSNLGPTP